MRQIVLTEDGFFEQQQQDIPEPADEEVLVEMAHVGICGSDIHYYEHGRIGDYVIKEPLVLGHESAGIVTDVGSDVTNLEPGDRVTLEPGVPCGECQYCRKGKYNLCPNVTFMATPPDDGAFTEFVTWDANFAYHLPSGVSTREGALCEPLSVALHATSRADVSPGDTVVITGAGPIGMLVLEAVKVAGASNVVVSDVVPEKLARARERGADLTVSPGPDDQEAIHELTDGRGADVVIEASGADPAIRASLDYVRRGGSVVCVGLSSSDEVPISTNEIVDNEIDFCGSFRFRNTYPTAVSLLSSGDVDVEGIIDFEMPLSDLTAAFEAAQEPDVIKGMVEIGDETGPENK